MPTIKFSYKRRDRTVNKVAMQKIYQDPRWRRLRDAKLSENPLCERCEAKGYTTLATEVHHKIPWQWGRTPEEIDYLAYSYDNTESICPPCHKEADAKLRIQKRGSLGGVVSACVVFCLFSFLLNPPPLFLTS